MPTSRMLTERPTFSPPRALRNGQVQTAIGNLPPLPWFARRRGAMLLASARPWVLDCGDGVRLQGLLSLAPGTEAPGGAQERPDEPRRIAVVLHGWEGSAESCYVISLGALLLDHGFDVLRLNLRDHGESHHLNRGIFHSCRLAEVVGATRAVAERFPAARLFLTGFSLGGNFMLRVAADAGAPEAIAGVAAVSPVLDPAATLVALERGWFLYRQYFVRKWSRSLRVKRRAWPDLPDFEPILRSRDLRAMTAGLVREFTDFPTSRCLPRGLRDHRPAARGAALSGGRAAGGGRSDDSCGRSRAAGAVPAADRRAHPLRWSLRIRRAAQRAELCGSLRGVAVRAGDPAALGRSTIPIARRQPAELGLEGIDAGQVGARIVIRAALAFGELKAVACVEITAVRAAQMNRRREMPLLPGRRGYDAIACQRFRDGAVEIRRGEFDRVAREQAKVTANGTRRMTPGFLSPPESPRARGCRAASPRRRCRRSSDTCRPSSRRDDRSRRAWNSTTSANKSAPAGFPSLRSGRGRPAVPP